MPTYCAICLKEDRFDPVTNYCSRCSDRKNKATIFSFLTGFCILMAGAIFARIYSGYTALNMVDDCYLNHPDDVSCFDKADALLVKCFVVGLSAGAILGLIAGILLHRRLSKPRF